jgi:hypothetical protein
MAMNKLFFEFEAIEGTSEQDFICSQIFVEGITFYDAQESDARLYYKLGKGFFFDDYDMNIIENRFPNLRCFLEGKTMDQAEQGILHIQNWLNVFYHRRLEHFYIAKAVTNVSGVQYTFESVSTLENRKIAIEQVREQIKNLFDSIFPSVWVSLLQECGLEELINEEIAK